MIRFTKNRVYVLDGATMATIASTVGVVLRTVGQQTDVPRGEGNCQWGGLSVVTRGIAGYDAMTDVERKALFIVVFCLKIIYLFYLLFYLYLLIY